MQEKLPFPWKYNLSASSFYKGYPSYNSHYTTQKTKCQHFLQYFLTLSKNNIHITQKVIVS